MLPQQCSIAFYVFKINWMGKHPSLASHRKLGKAAAAALGFGLLRVRVTPAPSSAHPIQAFFKFFFFSRKTNCVLFSCTGDLCKTKAGTASGSCISPGAPAQPGWAQLGSAAPPAPSQPRDRNLHPLSPLCASSATSDSRWHMKGLADGWQGIYLMFYLHSLLNLSPRDGVWGASISTQLPAGAGMASGWL